MTGSLFVFVASKQGTSPGIAVPPISPMEKGVLDIPQAVTISWPSYTPVHEKANDLLCDGSVSVDSLNITSESELFENVVHSGVFVKGRLRENIAFWQSIGARDWLLQVIREGYCLPFVDLPEG